MFGSTILLEERRIRKCFFKIIKGSVSSVQFSTGLLHKLERKWPRLVSWRPRLVLAGLQEQGELFLDEIRAFQFEPEP